MANKWTKLAFYGLMRRNLGCTVSKGDDFNMVAV